MAEAAAAVSALTHWDEHARSGCVLWPLAIEHAVMHGELDIRSGLSHLSHLSPAEAAFWSERLDEAETTPPATFNPNGWVVTALQAAWSSIAQTPATGPEHYVEALNTAIRIGNDTDTVAAIAGGLLGARWGAAAVPAEWRALSHGYPGISGEFLATLALDAVTAGRPH